MLLSACAPASKEARKIVKLEERADGLTYAVGQSEPYSGRFLILSSGGQIRQEQNFLEGRRHGPWRINFDGGLTKREVDYVNGEIVREREWFPSGRIKGDESMKNGLAFGPSQFWFEDGRIRKQVFVLDNLQPHGHILEFAVDGSVIYDAIYDHGNYVSGKRPEKKEPWVELRESQGADGKVSMTQP